MDRAMDDFLSDTFPRAQAAMATDQRRRTEVMRVAEKRRRAIERRETVKFWSGIATTVIPIVTACGAGIAAVVSWL